MFVRANNKFVKTNGYLKVFKEEEPLIKSFIKTPISDMVWMVDEINQNLNDESQLMFILRHSEREGGSTEPRPLTQAGINYAKDIGEKIQYNYHGTSLSLDNTVFYSTSVSGNRTKDTARYIGQGLFNTQVNVDDEHDSLFKISYDLPSSSWVDCASWSNNPSNEQSQARTSKEIINGCYKLLGDKRLGFFISHDFNTLPLTVWASDHNRTFDFKGNLEHNEWLCYMAGISVIVKDSIATVKPIYCIWRYFNQYGPTGEIPENNNGYHGVMRDKDNSGYGNVLHLNKNTNN